MSTTIALHTNYFVLNENNQLELVTHCPDQNYDGRKDRDQYVLAQGLFIEGISHELWISEVDCYRVIGTPMGLQTIKNLRCKIVAKQQYYWDMSKPMGKRKTDVKESNRWQGCFAIYKSAKA